MGYYDSLINASFKTNQDGKSIFYAYGTRSGYILSEDDTTKVKRFLKRYYRGTIIAVVVSVVLFGAYTFLLLLFIVPYYFINIKKFLLNAKKTHERRSMNERIQIMGRSSGVKTCVWLLVGGILMMGCSIYCIFLPEVRLIGILGTLLFGLGTPQFILMLKYAIQEKRGRDSDLLALRELKERKSRDTIPNL
jgi:purine-cytosine permease-like protein